MSESTQPKQNDIAREGRQPPFETPFSGSIAEALKVLASKLNQLPDSAKSIEQSVRRMEAVASDPSHSDQRFVPRGVAYAVQDFERATGTRLDLRQETRDLITSLAISLPNLENDRMLNLLRSTPDLPDQTLVNDIRSGALAVIRSGNQHTAEIDTQLHGLESRVRAAERPAGIANEARSTDHTQSATPPEPLREVLNKLLQNADKLAEPDKQLALTIRNLGTAARDPLQFNDTSVQHQIASAALDFEKVTGKPLDLSSAQRAEVTRLTAPVASPEAIAPPKTEAGRNADDAAHAAPDPIRDVLTKLVASVDQLPAAATNLATRIRGLETDATEPVRFNQKDIRHEIAYAAQDFEKATGRQLNLSETERGAVTKLADSAPGLENERMINLLRATSHIDDPNIVRQIRSNAAEIGKQSNQSTPETVSHIEGLENKVRLAGRQADAPAEAPAGNAPPKADQPAAAATGTGNDQRQQNNPTPRSTVPGPPPENMQATAGGVLAANVLGTVAAALRGYRPADSAPWDPKPGSMGDRIRDFSAKIADRDNDRTLGRAENSARAAVDALDGFRNTEGATIMNRIQTAARAEPGGMSTVLSEMRQGGRFGDLREAFNKAMVEDQGFSQAYDKAAAALARYGEGRENVEKIIAKRPDAANLIKKFEDLDAKVGERAGSTPSREDGKNMLDDIGKTVAEILQRAADKVRAMFSRAPAAGASPSPAA
jgi:hypothetical protein